MNAIQQQLQQARDLIADPERWTTDATARDEDGLRTHSASSPEAVSWCALGAMTAVGANEDDWDGSWMVLSRAARTLGYPGPVTLNDEGTGHDLVLKMFDLAIEMAGEHRDAE